MFLKSYSISFVGLFLVTFSAWAGTSAFDGVVKDPAGHPVKGADGLAVGIYKVTVVVNGAVKASILNASTQSGKQTQLNFELTPKTGTSKTHRVWIAADTGTHIGGGQWIDVDDNGNPANDNGVSSVEKFRVIQPPARTTYRVGQ